MLSPPSLPTFHFEAAKQVVSKADERSAVMVHAQLRHTNAPRLPHCRTHILLVTRRLHYAVSDQMQFSITTQVFHREWVTVAFVVSVASILHRWISELGLDAQGRRLTASLCLPVGYFHMVVEVPFLDSEHHRGIWWCSFTPTLSRPRSSISSRPSTPALISLGDRCCLRELKGKSGDTVGLSMRSGRMFGQ